MDTSGSPDCSVKGDRMPSPRSRSEPQIVERPPAQLTEPRIEATAADVMRVRDRPRKPTLGRWPYVAPSTCEHPPRLPSGRDWPRISVITPSFNQGDFVEETILSVINQNYPDLEYIMVDGGSDDGSSAIFAAYQRHFSALIVEKDDGQSLAINKGMGKASGAILTWLNADDMLAPGALFAAALALDYSDAEMVAGVCEIQANEQPLAYHLNACENGCLSLEELLDLDRCWNGGRFFYQPEVLFTKALWDRAGGRVRQDLYYSMDYELWLRFAKAHAKLHVIGRPIAIYRKHDRQKTHHEAHFKKELRRVRRKYVDDTAEFEVEEPGPRPGKPNLRVTLLSDVGFKYGAGIAQRRIGEAIAWAGHEIQSLSLLQPGNPESVYEELTAAITGFDPDVIILGNLHGARADPRLAGQLAHRWPVFIILHDFWWLTGRCAYTGDCSKYLEGCDASCPTSHEYPQLDSDKIAEAWRTKRAVLDSPRSPVLLGYSRWAASFARDALTTSDGSLSGSRAVQEFRIGVPTEVFRPQDMRLCRRQLGLPLDKFVVLISSASLEDQRKGVLDYARALEMLNLPDIITLAVGHSDRAAPDLGIPNLHWAGYLSNEDDIATLYGAADVFVGASAAETFGQVFIEAAACGTPVVAYDATGMKDSVATGITGLTARPGNITDLAARIRELYCTPELRRQIRFCARHYVENEYSLMRSYQSLFCVLRRSNGLRSLTMPEKVQFTPDRQRLHSLESSHRGAGREPQNGDFQHKFKRELEKLQKRPIRFLLKRKYPRLWSYLKPSRSKKHES
jgi:glycosyltransferase involved in cell wall biosynthesis